MSACESTRLSMSASANRRMPVANRRERMARDALPLVEDLDRRTREARLYDLADQL